MKWIGTKNLGMLLLGIWLTSTSALRLVDMTFVHAGSVLAVIAVAAARLGLSRQPGRATSLPNEPDLLDETGG